MNTLGRNRTFPIYKSDGTSFHDLVLHKSTCESVVMSLGDKITGDVYYKDNTLAVTMQEYIKFKVNPDDANEDEVKYVLVSPPTVIREGMVSDNSELKGMTKYSFTFYHPMYMLGNFPFTDIAVLPDQEKYLSQNKTFNWIGSFTEFVAKLNKNLENTEWVVSIASSVVLSKRNEIPEKPLSFDKQYISDAVKTCYDTWKVPFTISPIKNGEAHYNQGKRFLIQFGNPTEAIYEVDEHGQKTSTEYIFRFGQGVGLKNNSRTPRNNKIVTRIVGYGSERNIPYGYPQIPWYGNQDWDYTVDNDPNKPNSYPIYWGIYGGQYIKLIKHPFTRTTLMPSVYSQDVFNKVSPYIQGGAANVNYDPSIEIHDYYDAIDDQTHLYPNNVNPLAPSVEIHQFEDEYPHLLNMKIKAVEPYDDKYEYDSKKYTKITLGAFNLRITADMQATSNMNERAALGRLQNAINGSGTEFHEITNHASSYAFQCDASKVGDIWYVEYTSDNVNYNYAASNSFPAVKWDDTMDKDGKYNQSYFKITLPRLAFDLYACASIMEQMDINMRSGDCLGCTFPIQVDWDDYKANFYRADGTFDPVIHTSPNDGHVRDGIKYPDSSVGSIEIIVQKDIDTFGTLMPNTYQQPKGESAEGENDGDQFVILGISLPLSYITEAEERLDESMKQYMLENNVHYYDYPLKFDEHFLAENTGILAQIQNNVKVKFQYGGSVTSLFIKQIVIKFGEKVLPQYDITLTDDIEVVMSKLGQTTEDVSKLRVQMSELQKFYSENIINEINDKLSRIIDDVCLGRITFQQGLDSIGNTIFHEDARSADYSSGLGGRGWRVDKLGNAEFESVRIRSFLEVIELLINRQQAQEGDTVFSDNDQIDRVDQVVDENNGTVSYILSLKEKWDGYVTAQMYGNILKGVINTLAAKQSGVSDESGSSQGQGSDDGGNEFYTSWMHVVGTNATEPSLGVNQIRVVLYGDSDVPAQKNFAPCELMVIARRGCINYATPSSPQSVKDSIERRQRFFEISVTEGRVTKYTNVDRPVIQNGNYGVTIGELPDFVKRYAAVSRVLAQVGEHTDWLYAQGIVVGNMIKIDREGNLEVNYVDCGAWVDGSQIQEPTPRHGVYYYNTWNETAQQQETHDVWHNNAKWRCLQNQPVTVGGVTTYYEPSDANSEYWLKLEEGVAGTSPYFADLDNEMDSVPCTNAGVTTSAYDQTLNVGLWHGSNPMPISSMSYKVNNSTTYSDSRTIDGITVTPSAENKTIRIKVASGATDFAEHNDIEIIVAGSGSGSKELHFILNGVRAGSNGENAVIYNLKPSPDSINVAREDDGRYTPSTASIRCGYVKNDGGVMTEASTAYGLIDNTYRVYFRAKTRSNHAWAANFGLCTAAVSAPTNTVEAVEFVMCSRKEGVADFDSPISEATLSSNYNIIDRETVLIVADGMKGNDGDDGNDGVNYDIVLTIAQAKVDSDNIVAAELAGYAYKYEGSTQTALSGATIRYGYVLNDSDTYTTTTTNSSGFFDSQAWFYGDNIETFGKGSPTIFAALIIDGVIVHTEYVTLAFEGKEGKRGKMGRSFYYGEEWYDLQTPLYIVTDAQAPYFKHNDSYWVFNPEQNYPNGISMHDMGEPSSSDANWQIMTNDFKFIITEAIFGDFAHFGANIINGDYRYSQHGYMRGFYNQLIEPYYGADNYKNIDPSDPFGDDDLISKSDRKVSNTSWVNGTHVIAYSSQNWYYNIIGNNCQFAANSSPSASQIHQKYKSGDLYFRYRSEGASTWGGWVLISNYTFAISSNNGNTSSSPSSISSSWTSTPPATTQEKPYLWLKTASNACQRISSKTPIFSLLKNNYYAILIESLYEDNLNFNIRVGNETSYAQTAQMNLIKETYDYNGEQRLRVYGVFYFGGSNINNADIWISGDRLVYFTAIYKAQFIPNLCEDLSNGRLVVNNISARGQLHSESLYYEHIKGLGNNEIVVKDETIITIGQQDANAIVTLPAPTENIKGRVIEIYSGLKDGGIWKLGFDGATSQDNFGYPCGDGNQYKIANWRDWSETYVKLRCNGTTWDVIKAEKVSYEDNKYYVQLASKVHVNQ